VQRSFLGQVMTSRPCPACAGTGHIIPTPCPTCGTEGRVRSRRTLSVAIPAGIEDGMRIRLTGQGEIGPGGGPAGDLYVEIAEQANEIFTREGSDLHCTIAVPMTAAALGTEIPFDTLDSAETLDIRPGTQSGAVLTLRARGVPRLRGTGRGDLHVHVEVRTPTKLDAEQQRLLRELADIRDEQISVANPRTGGLFSKMRDAFR
jgi:molecular chaperone DnaJ